MIRKVIPRQPELNLGTLGHVDNGKSTVVQALTGTWTAKHSEEIKRGITIRIGYADAAFYRCTKCGIYGSEEICSKCGSTSEFLRAVSFIDCPGHHSLMVTMMSGAALMNGALLIISSTEKCPQPQDREHLAAAQIVGIEKIIIVQNKIDVVNRERILENFQEIQDFVKDTIVEKAPVVPVSAQRSINIDALIEAIETHIPTPQKDPSKPPIMSILRSFDINRPGTLADKITGGVIGGSILRGFFRVGDKIEIRPGIPGKKNPPNNYEPIFTEITSLNVGGKSVKKATSGGLVGIGTKLDPALTKADGLVGNIIGQPDTLPSVLTNLMLEVQLFETVIGTELLKTVDHIKIGEALVINNGTAVTAGSVISAKKGIVDISLRRPICIEPDSRIALSRKIGESWRLIGYGTVK